MERSLRRVVAVAYCFGICSKRSQEQRSGGLNDFGVRRVHAADLDTVAPLFEAYRQFYGQPAEIDTARSFLADRLAAQDSVIFLAFRTATNEGLGFTQLYPAFSSVAVRRIWMLNDLYVVPDARRSGVGRSLMEAARRHAVETGARKLVLATAHDNENAKRLYSSLGYVRETHFVQYKLELPLHRRARTEMNG